MTDPTLDAIRQRHVGILTAFVKCEPCCKACGQHWRCDAIILADRLARSQECEQALANLVTVVEELARNHAIDHRLIYVEPTYLTNAKDAL